MTKEKIGAEEKKGLQAQRFFQIAVRLPMELQMLLVNRTQKSTLDLIPIDDREQSFKSLATTWT